MLPVQIREGVHWVGLNDRTIDLFEGLWPVLREGVSYNSYLVRDDKVALIDLTRGTMLPRFLAQIGRVVDPAEIDYVVVNHMEQDHTGEPDVFRQLAPEAEMLGTPRTVRLLSDWYGLEDRVRAVEHGEKLSLGRAELQFLHAPFLHWPETMVTYDTGRRILFPCDAFGSYGALNGALFDDTCADLAFYEAQALRYYANIVAKFSRMVTRAIDALADVPVEVIAPSHGLVWRRDPGRIVRLYKRWASYAEGPAEPGVTLVYGSMYGFTAAMVDAVARGIGDAGLPLQVFDAARVHVSYILPSLWRMSGIMVGAPTYEGRLFPPVARVLEEAAAKSYQHKAVARFGSYGWGGGAGPGLQRLAESAGWDVVDSLEFKGRPTSQDLEKGRAFGAAFAEAIRAG
jgi:anaerobic nitric oxide reductase flavorubredoxin